MTDLAEQRRRSRLEWDAVIAELRRQAVRDGRAQPTASEFWERLERHYVPEPNSGCWLWTGCHTQGYGQLVIGGRHYRAHRLAYELTKGPIPEGLVLDHLCRVRCCINPDHLEAVTHDENCQRGHGCAAYFAARTHCPHGHLFDEQNSLFVGNYRRCRKCRGLPPKDYRRTHCKHGHELTPSNIYVKPSEPGWERCRECHLIGMRERRKRKREPRCCGR